jgi:hypothetical protein
MINQGSSEISMMFGVKAEYARLAVNALYDEFFRAAPFRAAELEDASAQTSGSMCHYPKTLTPSRSLVIIPPPLCDSSETENPRQGKTRRASMLKLQFYDRSEEVP